MPTDNDSFAPFSEMPANERSAFLKEIASHRFAIGNGQVQQLAFEWPFITRLVKIEDRSNSLFTQRIKVTSRSVRADGELWCNPVH